jgi:hypothetical protein
MKLSDAILLCHRLLNEFKTHFVANDVRLRASTAELGKLNTLVTDWNATFLKYVNTAQHTEGVVYDMQQLYDKVPPFLEKIRERIRNDVSVELTGADYASLGIKQRRHKRVHVEVYKTAPLVSASGHMHLSVLFTITDPANLKRRRKPDDVRCIGFKMAIVDANVESPKASDYKTLNPKGTTRYRHIFSPEDVGKKVFLIAYYMNNRGEAGVESKPASTFII